MATYNPAAVANGFLELGFRENIAVDPMKVQKLLYFAHGYYLAATGEPLVNELFQAWKLGPVLPSVYQRLKKFRGEAVTEYADVYDPALRTFRPAAPPEDDLQYAAVRQFVWREYGRQESMALSRLTHLTGEAWDRTLKKYPGIQGPQIPNDEIRKDFVPRVKHPAGAPALG